MQAGRRALIVALIAIAPAAWAGRIVHRGDHDTERARIASTAEVEVAYEDDALRLRVAVGPPATLLVPITEGGALGTGAFTATAVFLEASPLPTDGSVGLAVLAVGSTAPIGSVRIGRTDPPTFGLLAAGAPVVGFPYARLVGGSVPGRAGERGGGLDLVIERREDRLLGGARSPRAMPSGLGEIWYVPAEARLELDAAIVLDGTPGRPTDVPLDLAIVIERTAQPTPEIALHTIEITANEAADVNAAYPGIRARRFEVPVGARCRHADPTRAGDLGEFVWSHTGFFVSTDLGGTSPVGAGHLGEDYHASPGPGLGFPDHLGATVRAAAAGRVVRAERDVFEFGACWQDVVIVEHRPPAGSAWSVDGEALVALECAVPPPGFPPAPPLESVIYTQYGHLDAIESYVRVGEWVDVGQPLGVLAPVDCGGPHLHFEIKTRAAVIAETGWWRGAGAGYSYEAGCAPERYDPTVFLDRHGVGAGACPAHDRHSRGTCASGIR